jgi:hypothetical protein
VSFDSREQASRLFQSREYPRPIRFSGGPRESAWASKTPGFLVPQEASVLSFLGSVKTLCTKTKLPRSRTLNHLYRDASLTRPRPPAAGLANSVILHCSLLLGLLYVPRWLPPASLGTSAAFFNQEIIYYPVPARRPNTQLPRIAPKGPGGRPGTGLYPKEVPAPGKTVSNGNLTVISKPLHPDNFHQTIVQPASPPSIKIAEDLKLPNIALGTVAEPKKPSFDLSFKKPSKANPTMATDMASPVADTKPEMSMVRSLEPRNFQPKMPMPSDTMAKPSHHEFGDASGGGQEIPDIGAPGQGRAIMIIGVDPAGSMAQLAVPPGNRSGDFSIAPGNGGAGSPGGKSAGIVGGGSGGSGRGGDGSVGIGAAHEGGGGGKDGSLGSLSIKGVTGAASLDPRFLASMVYPVPWALSVKIPKNQMIVSAGPIGGGGLGVYGAMSCGKIFTIFLPMNETSWTMQYCPKAGPAAATQAASSSAVIHLEANLIPPNPDLDSRFDFKRLSVPPGKAHKLIVLKGTLREDGSVDGVEIYQGVVPQMDEAARLAFSRWKFKPAMRAGKPVALELLVGIPTESTSSEQSR